MMAQESGCNVEHPTAMKFRTCVMEGDWDQVCTIGLTQWTQNVTSGITVIFAS